MAATTRGKAIMIIKTATEQQSDLKNANFIEQINPYLDAIDFVSITQAPAILDQMHSELQLLPTADSDIKILRSVHELYIDAELYVADPEDIPMLRSAIINRVNNFIINKAFCN